MMPGHLPDNYVKLHRDLKQFIPKQRLASDPLRTLAYGSDASFYRLVPKLVVEVTDEGEVIKCLNLAKKYGTPVTFRAAGTSLSGQAITDSVLIRLGWGWREYSITDDGLKIRLQAGVIGGDSNHYLKPYQRKIGPDPASINAARIGGIAANNASGMCCGNTHNSYETLHSMRIVLADGALLDTGNARSREAFTHSHREMLESINTLAKNTRNNKKLAERIRHKFRIKNTTGYSLNALIDFEDPVDILQHLMIGSEGTLGFISEITLKTQPDYPHKASALVFFTDVQTACDAVTRLKSLAVDAVELMDRSAIRSVENKPGMPELLKNLPPSSAALLIETRAADRQALHWQIDAIEKSLGGIKTLYPLVFTDREDDYSRLWNIRKGLFPSVGAMRETGTTVIIEDVAFPLQSLAAATLDLQALFKKYAYHEAIIFGHALAGNLHFVFTQDFGSDEEVERYHQFMDEVCHLVVDKYDGSLKGEHSTGRNMAPYVELEWGADAYRLMQQIKHLFDPAGLLNPGVILNEDPKAHVSNLKPLPAADPLIDKCIECGFCEPACPARALSLTPRQRIVGLREISRLKKQGQIDAASMLEKRFQYQGIDTCAGDSLCSIACPVGIDTGYMMKVLRSRNLGERALKIADWSANHFEDVCDFTHASLGVANFHHKLLGSKITSSIAVGLRKLSANRIPLWNASMPTAANKHKHVDSHAPNDQPRLVYFPSCASRNMGPAKEDPEPESLVNTTDGLLRKAGYEVVYPANTAGLCCGMPFESKGAMDAAESIMRETEQALLHASRQGRDPIVFDTSPCLLRMKQQLHENLQLFDITEFIHDVILPKLKIEKLTQTIALHPTCSTRKMGLNDKLINIAQACAEKVILPDGITCCGWGGDKGFTQPELNASALRNLRTEIPENCVAGYSTSRTCEIGLSLHSGKPYRSIVYLVDQCSRARYNSQMSEDSKCLNNNV